MWFEAAVVIAVLYVMKRGSSYSELPGVELWDEVKDARKYAGPHPVVAHPPCARWSRLAGLVQARWGHKMGDDRGCFASALDAVRTWRGVLEHPAYSKAWDAYGLAKPPRQGGWVKADDKGGYTCHVEQNRYGHRAKKATWLYAVVDDPAKLPELKWGSDPDRQTKAWVSWCGDHNCGAKRRRLTKKEALATPKAFRDTLIEIAKLARTNG